MRFRQRDGPKIINPTDVIICTAATCVRGSDLWDHRVPPLEQVAEGHRAMDGRRAITPLLRP